MYFKQKSNVLFRQYNTFGFITDNDNFAYKINDAADRSIGEKILSESGAIFFSALSRKPQSLDDIVSKIAQDFVGVDINTISSDAMDFYVLLVQDGFVASGETEQECENNDYKFSYKYLDSKSIDNYAATADQAKKSTQEFLDEHFKEEPRLTDLHIEITSRCNERCVHCYIPHDNKLSDIEPQLFFAVLEQCRDLKLLHLTLSGGEPMLHKSFCAFLKKCREYDFSVSVLSNLTLLNDEIIKEMKANPLLGVQVSLYSMDPSIHDSITEVKGSLAKTKAGIMRLIEEDIPMQISCPIMNQNKHTFEGVKNWAKQYRIHVSADYVIIARYNHTTQNLSARLSINDIKEMLTNSSTNDKSYWEQVVNQAENKKHSTQDDYICSVCTSSICVSENGNVYPCAGWQDYSVGNVNTNSLKDIWNNSERIRYLRNLRRKDFPKCIECPDKDYCTMCMVRNANEDPTGNPLNINDYFCKIANLYKQITLDMKSDNSQ